jgi:chemotaxis protein MotB
MRKKAHPEHENHERWLVSYADFITLMFAFFVVMFASSQADKGRIKQVSESVNRALEKGASAQVQEVVARILGGSVDDKGKGSAAMKGPGGQRQPASDVVKAAMLPQPAELLPSLEYLKEQLKREIGSGKMRIGLEARGLVVSLEQSTFFPSGEDTIDPATYPSLEKVATAISKLPNPVRLEGHTDAVPIHTARFRSNWELSAARAIAVLQLLNGRFEIPRDRMAIGGYAETVPVAPNDSERGRARNRRVDIVILNHQQAVNEPVSAAGATSAQHGPPGAGAQSQAGRPAQGSHAN